MNIWPGLGTLDYSWSGVTPTPKNENFVRTWHLGFELVWSTPPHTPHENLVRTSHFGVGLECPHPPPQKENLVRTWHLGFELIWSNAQRTYVGALVWRLIAVSFKDIVWLPSVTKLRQGNFFTSVCQEFCPQGGLPQCMLGYTPREDTPPGQTPHSTRLLQRTVRILLECILVCSVMRNKYTESFAISISTAS